MNVNVIARFESNIIRTRWCDKPGCGVATKGNKYLCVAHSDEMPYVQGLLSRMSEREHETKMVAREGWKAVNVQSSLSQEILCYLRAHGKATTLRIGIDLPGTRDSQQPWIEALSRNKLIRTTISTRGVMIVQVA